MVVGKSIITVFTSIVKYRWSVLRVGMTLPINFKLNPLTYGN